MNDKKQPPRSGNANRGRRRNYKKKGNKPKGPYLSPQERVFKKYLNLLEQHIAARKKYFELFYRADPQQKAKLERIFDNTVDQLRSFEDSLNEDEQKLLKDKIEGQGLDTDYTLNHQLPENEGEPVEGKYEDPHFLPSQDSANFMEDKEESQGSMDDYLKYKGLSS